MTQESGNIVKWGTYTAEAADAEAEQLAKMSSGNYHKLAVGKNRLRILPPRVGQPKPYVMTFQHFFELPGMKDKVSFNCPRKMANMPCPVCRKADALRNTGNQRDYEAAGNLIPKLRVYANVIDRNDEEAGVKILPFGKTVYDALVELRRDESAGGNYSDPIKGFDVTITRKGTGRTDTEYVVLCARESTPLGDTQQINEWIEAMPDLARLARVPTEKDIFQMVTGQGGDLDMDEQPPRRPRPPAAPRARTAESDTFDEDEDK